MLLLTGISHLEGNSVTGNQGKTICVVEKVKNEMPQGWCQVETLPGERWLNPGGNLHYLLGYCVPQSCCSSLN